MDKLKMHSPDLTQDNIAKIRELFPGCVTEAKSENGETKLAVNFDQLKQELSDSIVDGPQERYQLDWPGKREALLAANAPIAKTLRPCREESVNFDTTKNLFIEGDNLEALKLLQETYLGKVKMIYIDPPYNTGSDFIYEDDFSLSVDEYLIRSNQHDDELNRLIANTESNGRFHSDWISMIYPRLRLARNLLCDDGLIYISIANDEFANLKSICDEVFGEKSFIECITWNKRIPKNDKGIGNIHDFILVYAKNHMFRQELHMRKDGLSEIDDLLVSLRKRKVPLGEAEEEIKKLYKKQGYDRGITLYNSLDNDYQLWGKINMSWPSSSTAGPRYEVLHPATGRPVKMPDRGWRWKVETFNEASGRRNGVYENVEELHDGSYRCGRLWFSSDDEQQPSTITYLNEVSNFLLRSILSLKSDGGIEVSKLFDGSGYFSHPKPTELLKVLMSAKDCEDGDIVMDFFAGSCTTAHALMKINAEDNVQRNYIMVQLPEECAIESQAFSDGYKTIADIGKERIRRSADSIRKSYPSTGIDCGFRVLKMDSSNMADVYYQPDEVNQGSLDLQTKNIKSDRSDEDLLFQVLLDWGVDLALPIRKETIQDKTIYFVDDNALVACFEEGVDEDLVKELAKHEPLRVVFLDAGFTSDAVKINVEQIFKQLSPATEVKAI